MEKCNEAPIKSIKILFWTFKIKGWHKYKPTKLKVTFPGNNTFEVVYECEYCGMWKTKHFVELKELLNMGIKMSLLKEISHDCFHYHYLDDEDFEG